MKNRTTTNHWIICAVLFCVLAVWPARSLAQETPVTNLVTLTTFDYDFDTGVSHTLRWSYPYKYDWGGDMTYWHSELFSAAYYDPNDWQYTNAMGQFAFDNTGYGEFMTNYPGAGYGVGCGGALNWTNDASVLVSTNREDYILSFDVRAEGLKEGLITVGGEFQIRFEAPDDTLSPPDDGTDYDNLMQVNLNFNASSNWQHHVFTLDQGTIGAGSLADFIAHKDVCNGQGFGINYHQPEGGWDYDADNNLYVDNIRLEVVQKAPPPPPPPKMALAIFDFNFDDKPLGWSWTAFPGGTGWSANANTASYWVDYPAAGAGVDGSQAYIMAMDNSAIATDPPGVPQWAGGNTGGGGLVDYTLLTSPDLKDYQLVLDARVEGLADGQTTTPLTAQIHFRAPDDTIQPPDTDTNADVIVVMNVDFQGINTNWLTRALLLKAGSAQSGSTANFSSYYGKINSIDFQFQINNSANTTLWGTDADNQIVIDNFRLERLVVASPPLVIQTLGNNAVVSWAAPDTGTVMLLTGNTLTAVTNEVVGATSPYTNAISGDMKYFRTQWVPPTP